jgi:hypothetical protein
MGVVDLAPGVWMEVSIAPQRALTVRVTHHDGGKLIDGVDTTQLHCPTSRSLWFAVYGAAILNNGWQPFDQPNPAAYVPLPFSAMTRDALGLGSEFVLLGQKQPTAESGVRPVARAGRDAVILALATAAELRTAVNEALQHALLPDLVREQVANAITMKCKASLPLCEHRADLSREGQNLSL